MALILQPLHRTTSILGIASIATRHLPLRLRPCRLPLRAFSSSPRRTALESTFFSHSSNPSRRVSEDDDEPIIWTHDDWQAWKAKVHHEWHDHARKEGEFSNWAHRLHDEFCRKWAPKPQEQGRSPLDLGGGKVLRMLKRAEEEVMERKLMKKRQKDEKKAQEAAARAEAARKIFTGSAGDRWLRRALERRLGQPIEDVLASDAKEPQGPTSFFSTSSAPGKFRPSWRDRWLIHALEHRFGPFTFFDSARGCRRHHRRSRGHQKQNAAEEVDAECRSKWHAYAAFHRGHRWRLFHNHSSHGHHHHHHNWHRHFHHRFHRRRHGFGARVQHALKRGYEKLTAIPNQQYHGKAHGHGHGHGYGHGQGKSRGDWGGWGSRRYFEDHHRSRAFGRWRFHKRYIHGGDDCPVHIIFTRSFWVHLVRKLAENGCRHHEKRRRAAGAGAGIGGLGGLREEGEWMVRRWAGGLGEQPAPVFGAVGGEMGEERRWSGAAEEQSKMSAIAKWIVGDSANARDDADPPDIAATGERGERRHSRPDAEPASLTFSYNPGSVAPPPHSSTSDPYPQIASLLAALKQAPPGPTVSSSTETHGHEHGKDENVCLFGSSREDCPAWLIARKRHRTSPEKSHRLRVPFFDFRTFEEVPPIPPAMQASICGPLLELLPAFGAPTRPFVSTASVRGFTRASLSLVTPLTALLRSISLPTSSRWMPLGIGVLFAVVLPLVLAAINAVAGKEETPYTGRMRRVALTGGEVEALQRSLLPIVVEEGDAEGVSRARREHWVRVLGEMMGDPSGGSCSPAFSSASSSSWSSSSAYGSDAGSCSGSSDTRLTLMGCDVLEDEDARVWWVEGVLDMLLESQGMAKGGERRYDVLMLDREEENAFGFGFAPDESVGSRGVIVVYSGVLDAIMNAPTPSSSRRPSPPSSVRSGDWDSASSFDSSSSFRTALPSTAQTHSLSLVLAHELAHLVLSHPLESLSSHRTASLLRDVVDDALTALVWPVASALGPWGAEVGGKWLRERARRCTEGWKKGEEGRKGWWMRTPEMESEADEVALKIMSDAGFEPRLAVAHWCGGDSSRFGHVAEGCVAAA